LAADTPTSVSVSGLDSQLSAVIEGSELVISWTLPLNGGAEITEGQIEIRQSDGQTFSEEVTYCLLAEDSQVFDSRTCTIPLTALRQDDTASNVY